MKKIMKRFIIIVAAALLLVLTGGIILFRGELTTILNLHKVNDYPFYEMKYRADYKLSEFEKEGANSDQALEEFLSDKVVKFCPDFKLNPEGACSTFSATTPENDYLFCRNFDFFPSTALLVHTTPKDGYHSLSMVNLNHINYNENSQPTNLFNRIQVLATPYLVLDGMNEKGLAVGVLTVDEQRVHQDTGKLPVTTTSALRLLLDRAATVEEAIKLLEGYDMNSSSDSTGYHFQIADATGDSAVIEYLRGEMVVLRKGNKSYIAATNFTLSSANHRGVGKSHYETLVKGLNESKGILTEEQSMQLLSDVTTVENSPNGNAFTCNTQWSVVYNLSEKTMKVCIGMDYDTVYEYKVD